jgi:hypothetical protein
MSNDSTLIEGDDTAAVWPGPTQQPDEDIGSLGGESPGRARDRREVTADVSWMLWSAIGIGGIWIAVLLLRLFAPDVVSGSEPERLPVAAFTTWYLGGADTLVVLWAMGRHRRNRRPSPPCARPSPRQHSPRLRASSATCSVAPREAGSSVRPGSDPPRVRPCVDPRLVEGQARAACHQRCATSITMRLPLPGPVSVRTRKGSRARTPRPIVVWPSKVPAEATWRNVRYPETFVSSRGLRGR